MADKCDDKTHMKMGASAKVFSFWNSPCVRNWIRYVKPEH